jgi:hypothetical protein
MAAHVCKLPQSPKEVRVNVLFLNNKTRSAKNMLCRKNSKLVGDNSFFVPNPAICPETKFHAVVLRKQFSEARVMCHDSTIPYERSGSGS